MDRASKMSARRKCCRESSDPNKQFRRILSLKSSLSSRISRRSRFAPATPLLKQGPNYWNPTIGTQLLEPKRTHQRRFCFFSLHIIEAFLAVDRKGFRTTILYFSILLHIILLQYRLIRLASSQTNRSNSIQSNPDPIQIQFNPQIDHSK
jgi:hypothetical protein